MLRPRLALILLPLLCSLGCDEREKPPDARREQQLEQLQQQASKNSAAAQTLVEADAHARSELVSLQRELETDQRKLADERDALEAERRELAAARQRTPLLAAALYGLGAILLGAATLGICALLLRQSMRDDGSTELVDALVLELVGESRLLAAEPTLPPPENPLISLAAAGEDAAPAPPKKTSNPS